MDKDITEQEPNDFKVLKKVSHRIRLICFNGQSAAELEESLLGLGYQTRRLPSSSPANRKDNEGRLRCWKAIFD
jgi:G:T/U-mismatch repair DNA glycosylase